MAYRTFGEIKTFAMDMLSEDEQNSVFQRGLLSRWATRTRDRINNWHSWTWKEGLIRLTWPGAAGGEVASVLYLPEDVGEIISMYPNNLSYREPVKIIQRWEFDHLRPGNSIGRGQDFLVLWGYYGVRLDNPSTGTLDVVATGATPANAENIRARITGRDQNNDFAQEILTIPAGGTVTSSKQYLGGAGRDGVVNFEIESSSLVGKTPGYGPIELQRGGTTLESLDAEAGEISKERRRTELYAQTSSIGTYQVAYYRRFKPLRAESDQFLTEIPNEFADIPELGIMSQIAMFRKEWASRQQYEVEFHQRLRELVAWTNRADMGNKRRLGVNRQFGTRVSRR